MGNGLARALQEHSDFHATMNHVFFGVPDPAVVRR